MNPLWKNEIKVGLAIDALNYVKTHAGYQIVEYTTQKAQNLLDAIDFDRHATRLYAMQLVVDKYPHVAKEAKYKFDALKKLKNSDEKIKELMKWLPSSTLEMHATFDDEIQKEL